MWFIGFITLIVRFQDFTKHWFRFRFIIFNDVSDLSSGLVSGLDKGNLAVWRTHVLDMLVLRCYIYTHWAGFVSFYEKWHFLYEKLHFS